MVKDEKVEEKEEEEEKSTQIKMSIGSNVDWWRHFTLLFLFYWEMFT